MERNLKLDNLKSFLIFTVVFGHLLEFSCGDIGIYGILRAVIYSFHMPTFVFISGYLSKKSKKPLPHITVMYLSTYVIFNTLFGLTPWRATSPLNLMFPQFIYWYLLSLCIWRISIPALSKIKFIIPISIIMALYIGFFADADRFLALSKTFCFFPFFLIGYYFKIQWLERVNKSIFVLLFILSIVITIIANFYSIIPVKMYDYIQSYSLTGVDNVHGIIMRFILMLISCVLVLCLIFFASSSENYFTNWGRNSLTIYLFHLFIVMPISQYLYLISNHYLISIGLCLVTSFFICMILSIQSITDKYNCFINRIVSLFLIGTNS